MIDPGADERPDPDQLALHVRAQDGLGDGAGLEGGVGAGGSKQEADGQEGGQAEFGEVHAPFAKRCRCGAQDCIPGLSRSHSARIMTGLL